jgi:hypothetical protein
MSKSFDELLKLLEEKKTLSREDVEKVTKEHGDLSDEEKTKLAARAKELEKEAKEKEEKKEEEKKEEKKDAKGEEVSMDEYLQALSVMDSDDESEEAKAKAKKVIEAFESQS